MKIKKDYLVVSILFISFIVQYNFLFSAHFLWLNYWSGSGIRTGISFLTISLCIIIYSRGFNLKLKPKSIITALTLYFTYGFIVGLLNNELSVGMIAEGIFWLEIIIYIILLQNINRAAFAVLIRMLLIYSSLNGVLSILYFWVIKDQIAVAALIGEVRIVRVADLLSPLLVLLFLLYNKVFLEKLSNLYLIPLLSLVLLGMFRSVWAAFLISYFFSNIIFPSIASFKRVFYVVLIGISFILIFEWFYEYLFQVDSVILGRIVAGIGTQDSLGRVSSAKDVLDQFFENPLYVIFGAGFGKLVWFVNDFGEGEVFALQPLGSLSNYYVVFLFQVGFFVSMIYLVYAIYSFNWIKKKYKKTDARLLTFICLYFLIQWLTFPTSIHYPVALILGIYFTVATKFMTLKTELPLTLEPRRMD